MKNILFLLIATLLLTSCTINNDLLINDDLQNNANTNTDLEVKKLIKPVEEFDSRITKKPFGVYITPQTSPVQPEKFTGYHTGVDIEYADAIDNNIVVRAIADGVVVRSGWVSGYGGMIAIGHNIDNKDYIVIYGHLDPDSLPLINTQVFKGDDIAILGKGYSNETDGERKHLHFAIYTGKDINVRGYVASKAELAKWLDPVEFLK
ncbi:MAG: M23 family metallopeptidase [Patescibacteria group bacterium]|jgi:murein DD-endopeptidase MepM/ murein hydrolase activator NlpD